MYVCLIILIYLIIVFKDIRIWHVSVLYPILSRVERIFFFWIRAKANVSIFFCLTIIVIQFWEANHKSNRWFSNAPIMEKSLKINNMLDNLLQNSEFVQKKRSEAMTKPNKISIGCTCPVCLKDIQKHYDNAKNT